MTGMLIAMLFAGVFFAAIIIVMRRADSAIKDLYSTDRERWRELGSPTGYFWRPKERGPFFRSIGARDEIGYLAAFSPNEFKHLQIRKEPNKPNQPPPKAVTPPAAQEPRRP